MAKQERNLPDAPELEFIIADESVNRNGWRLIVDGIDTASFEKNPVCVVQHNQWMVSVGRWTSLSKEKGVLKGKLLFDGNDEYAVSLYWKYVDGFMSAVSLSVVPLTESEEKKDLLPGQRYATVTASELLEISLVTVPANGNAVRLCYSDGKEYKASLLTTNLHDEMDKKDERTIEQLQAELQVQKRLNAENLIALHKQRGVVADGEVAPMTELATENYDNVKKVLEARPTPATASAEQTAASTAETMADALVKLHFDRGAVTEQEKPVYKAAATADYEGTRKVLEAKPGTQQAKDFVQGLGASKSQSAADDRAGWGYMDYFKRDAKALAAIEKNEPERHKKLVADFQAECEANGIVA